MNRRPLLLPTLVAMAVMATGQWALAVVIDDFSTGDIVVDGRTIQDQTGLDPSRVLGGSRRLDVGRSGEGSHVEIADDRLNFNSTGRGYVKAIYGAVAPLSDVDLTQNGHDRFRISFGDITSPYTLMWLYVNLTPNSSYNVGWTATQGLSGLTIEVPYSSFPVPFTAVNTLTFDAARNPAGTGFEVELIATAGPSLPGDFNRDGAVDGADLAEWKQSFGVTTSAGSPRVFATSDANLDGRVDGADYLIWQRAMTISGSDVTNVPEPAAWSLLILAAFGCRTGCISRRRLA